MRSPACVLALAALSACGLDVPVIQVPDPPAEGAPAAPPPRGKAESGALPARQRVKNVHVGGVCSTSWATAKGQGSALGAWAGEESVDAAIDQRSSTTAAAAQLARLLDEHCPAGADAWCNLYGYSNAGAVISYALSTADDGRWQIGYVVMSASNEGGSEIGGTGWIAQIFGVCALAGRISTTDNRAWNHNDTGGVTFYQAGGRKCMVPWAQCALLPGEDDGAVAFHSAGGLNDTYEVDELCQPGLHWDNHEVAWSCRGFDLTHWGMKRKGVCLDGGCGGS